MKIINVIALVCVSLTVMLTSNFLTQPSVIYKPQPTTSINNKNIEAEKAIAGSSSPTAKIQNNADGQPPLSPIAHLDTEGEQSKYSHLTNHQSINEFFFNPRGELKAEAVKTVLTSDIKEFIEQASELPLDNELASRRQELLNQQLLTLKDSNIFDQRIACAGNACILSLITDGLSTEGKAHLAEFDSNISFISANTNDAGELEFNAIYLHNEDPSHLVIATP